MKDNHHHHEETKLTLKKSDVTISPEGHITIKDPKLVKKLTSINVKNPEHLASDDVGVGVVVSQSF